MKSRRRGRQESSEEQPEIKRPKRRAVKADSSSPEESESDKSAQSSEAPTPAKNR